MKKIYEKPQAIVTTFNTVDATNANIKSNWGEVAFVWLLRDLAWILNN